MSRDDLLPRLASDTSNRRKDVLNRYSGPPCTLRPGFSRHAVIFRKISFGSRSLHGAQATAANLSLLTTAHRQQRNPLDLLHTILLHSDRTPLSMLYQPDAIPASNSS